MFADASCRALCRYEADFPAENGSVFQGKPDEFWAEQGGAVNIIDFRKIDMYGFEKIGYFKLSFFPVEGDHLYRPRCKKDKESNNGPAQNILQPLCIKLRLNKDNLSGANTETQDPDENENKFVKGG